MDPSLCLCRNLGIAFHWERTTLGSRFSRRVLYAAFSFLVSFNARDTLRLRRSPCRDIGPEPF